MKINEFFNPKLNENHIDIYYREKTEDVEALLQYLYQTENFNLVGYTESGKTILNPYDIFYFEAVDKRCYAYLKEQVYQVDIILQNLENTYFDLGFIRVNKSVVINVFKIDYMKAEANMKINAYLTNGETIVVNRHYKKDFQLMLRKLLEGDIT